MINFNFSFEEPRLLIFLTIQIIANLVSAYHNVLFIIAETQGWGHGVGSSNFLAPTIVKLIITIKNKDITKVMSFFILPYFVLFYTRGIVKVYLSLNN